MFTPANSIASLLLQTLDGLAQVQNMRDALRAMESNDSRDIDRASNAIETVMKRTTEARLRFRLSHYSACH